VRSIGEVEALVHRPSRAAHSGNRTHSGGFDLSNQGFSPVRHISRHRFSDTPLDCSFVRRFSFADLVGKLFLAAYAAIKAGRYRSPLDNTAHVIRASLCAMATITTFRWALASSLIVTVGAHLHRGLFREFNFSSRTRTTFSMLRRSRRRWRARTCVLCPSRPTSSSICKHDIASATGWCIAARR
jgi:hypothetical protein